MLYDFTLDVGDIFESEYIGQPLIVIESDTMILSDRSKMRYWTLACTENPDQTITWMENIGTNHGVAWPQNFCSGDYGDETFTCFYRHERLAHMNPDVGGCLLPTSTNDEESFLQLSSITAYPNPAQERLTISSPELTIQRIDILDTQGKTQTYFYDNILEIDINVVGYISGLYFISIYTDKGSLVKKVVVE